jgi:hypothetical protein
VGTEGGCFVETNENSSLMEQKLALIPESMQSSENTVFLWLCGRAATQCRRFLLSEEQSQLKASGMAGRRGAGLRRRHSTPNLLAAASDGAILAVQWSSLESRLSLSHHDLRPVLAAQGFASPRNIGAPLTAPGRSEKNFSAMRE